MPLGLRRGVVTAWSRLHERLIRLEVDGIACIAYPRLTGEVEVGDEVLVNEQARVLELGSGGFDVLYANLTRGLGLEPEEGAHVMALPYTPGQVAVCYKEESGELAASLGGVAGRLLHAAQPGRAGVRRARRAARRLRSGRGRRAAGLALRHGARAPEDAG